MNENVLRGYLDVKISSKSRRGFTPWKAWQRQWCELRRLDEVDAGVELKLKNCEDGCILDRILVPRSATLCRTESRTKQFAFGIFNLTKTKRPFLFLSGNCESDSQEWMNSIRQMLSIASYIAVGDSNFRVSLIDSSHSRSSGLFGLFGVLCANMQEIIIFDPSTGAPKVAWKWYYFHHFHLQATCKFSDYDKIVVMHTSQDFPVGAGQLLFYCREASLLLHYLITRGNGVRFTSSLLPCKRLSRSEGNLCGGRNNAPDTLLCFQSQAGSDDSGVPIMDDKVKAEFNFNLTKTPGSSLNEDFLIQVSSEETLTRLPRNESGISLSSGIYEEIPDDHQPIQHIYENPFDPKFGAPPLPPRSFISYTLKRYKEMLKPPLRCNTLPAKDLYKIFNNQENDYVVMSPGMTTEKVKTDNFYVPTVSGGDQVEEGVYMTMTRNSKKTV